MRGTYVWEKVDSDCPDTLVQLYWGDLKFFVNSTEAGSLVGGLAVLDKDDQVAGLELVSPLLLCSHAAWKTHLNGIFFFTHLFHRNDTCLYMADYTKIFHVVTYFVPIGT